MILERLSSLATATLKTAGATDGEVLWESPPDFRHGDFTTSAALRFGKQLGKSPKDLAQSMVDAVAADADVLKAEIAGAGYVNVWLKPKALLSLLPSTAAVLSAAQQRKEPPVIIEYSGPNIAKPLGIHHILGTVIGQALVNVYRHGGTPVVAWNYIGDWGTQFGKLAVAIEKWAPGATVKGSSLEDLLALYVRFHDEAEKNAALEDEARAAFAKLEQGDAVLKAFWSDVVAITKASLQDLYKRLHVSFDVDLGESFYSDKMAPVLEEGKKKGVFKEGKEGALIVEFPEELGYPPYLVQKGDGATLYSTRDIAQMRYRTDTYKPAAILICTDIAQKLHFEQLAATCAQLGWKLPPFENVLFGRMRFADKSMSTRKGNILRLQEVLDEAVERAASVIAERGESIQTEDPKDLAEMMGVGALVYGILSQNRKMDLVFDWEKMLSFDGNSAPYLMYTHARARSVLRKAQEGAVSVPADVPALEDGERALVGMLLKFPSVLDDVRRDHLPHKLANYLFALCQEMNGFYNSFPILQSEGAVRHLRLSIVSLTADVLRTGASLLTLRLPDAM